MVVENLRCSDTCKQLCCRFDDEDCCRCCPERVRELCHRFQLCRHGECLCSDFDTLLMAAFAEGEDWAFDLLYWRNLDWARKLAFHLIGSWQDAHDIAQEAFLRVIANRNRWRPTAKFQTWFHRIVVNLSLKQRKSEKPDMSLSELMESEFGEEDMMSQTLANPEEILLAAEQMVQLQQAVEKLPYRQRQAILLWSEGASYQQIAQNLGCSVSAVETLLHRAKRNLRKLLERDL